VRHNAVRSRRERAGLFILFLIGDGDLIIFVVIALVVDGRNLQWVSGDDLQIGAALVAGDDLTLFYFILVDIQRGIALWADD